MRPRNQLVWKHYRQTENKSVTCKYCGKKYVRANIVKMAGHLIKRCEDCPENFRQEIDQQQTNKSRLARITNESIMIVEENHNMENNRMVLVPHDDENALQDSESVLAIDQSSSLVSTNEEQLQSLLAKAIYVSRTPLSIVEHPLWINFFKETQPSFNLPSRKDVSTTILDKTYVEMHQQIKENIRSQPCLHLMIDGWSNSRNEGIINILIAIPEPVYVKSFEMSDNIHSSHYISQQISDVLSEYGAKKFSTIIGNNAIIMQKAFKLVKDAHPNITFVNCAAHTLNLLCKKIVTIDEVNTCTEMAVKIIKNIKKNQLLSSLLAKIIIEKKSGETLKLPCDNRWDSYYRCFKSIDNTKIALKTLAVHKKAKRLLAENRAVLLTTTFWDSVEQCKLIMEPIFETIIQLERNESNIHKVFLMLKNIKSEFEFKMAEITVLEDDKKHKIMSNIDDTIEMCLKPIHFAAYLLDPRAQGIELEQDQEIAAMEYISEVGQSMGLNIMPDLACYKAKGGFWTKRIIWSNIDQMSAAIWWQGICRTTSLSKVAVRILTAPCTSTTEDRSFSAPAITHNKIMHNITAEQAAKLTSIAYNWNILNKHENESSENTERIASPVASPSAGIKAEFLNCYGNSDISDDDMKLNLSVVIEQMNT